MDRSLAPSAPAQEATRRASRARRGGGAHIRFGVDRDGMSAALRCDCLSLGAVSRPTRRIRSIVFDTAVNDLSEQNISLRGYETHGASFVELSWARPVAAGGARGSIELRVPTLDMSKMLGFSDHLRRSVAERPLEARCVAETERRERVLEYPDARIAVTFDEGVVESGGARAPFHEIELRLLDGAERKLWSVAADLTRRAPVRCLPMSEMERAIARTAGTKIAPVKAERAALEADASLDEAIVVMLSSCLDQFVANWPALRYSREPEEAIHQMRVALRRLRAGVGLLRRGVASPALEAASARAESLAATLGEARNHDVLHDMLTEGPLTVARGEPGYYALIDAAERRRIAAHAEVQTLIAAPETTRFVVDLRAALTARDWRESPAGEPRARPDAPIDTGARGSARRFAVASLDRLHRKAMKMSRDLGRAPPERRHEARIAFKKARYAAEFFQSLFDAHSRARRYLRHAAVLQDALGAVNDLAVAAELLRRLSEASPVLAQAGAFAAGWCAHARGAALDEKAADRSRKKLEPFWR